MAHILWFDRHDSADNPRLGGKNASLGSLTSAGLPVPPGFAVTADAYRQTMQVSGAAERVTALMAALDPTDTAAVERTGRAVRELMWDLPVPEWLGAQVDEAYAELCARCGTEDVPVAVRSSATCEDQPDASFAGEHDTYLWIRGREAVAAHMLRCWASLYTDRAIAYRRQMNYSEDGVAMSVGIQQMVLPRAAGVAFTLNPLDGDRSQIAIDAAWGLGEAVVSGSVTPDNFLVDKVLGDITRRTISPKIVEHRLEGDRVVEAPISDRRRHEASLTDDEVRAVARMARRAEKHYGCPQDVEWAIDPLRPADDSVVLLQSRPETVWSRKPKRINGVSGDTFTSIVHTLLHPHTAPSTSHC